MNEQPNLVYIKKIADGDAAFEKKLIEVIKEELPKEVLEYECYLKRKDFIKASGIVHKLIHKISILGLAKSYVAAKKHEQALMQNDTIMHMEFQSIIRKMSDFINNK
ncbi:hypothetical protein KCTC32516_01315 [Polaribacter huanghezhanensis]|uniref:Hpt domain-containing protein n=1 Tax=Polaribacter huanghezhanensis TaxID=1354726 RepID=UPI002648317A|nr:Hpt domain-containing protein [Polaribacter huanghezhanensis]WKD85966.1 hypothetical protein KCTC32516_01315 [Polaribacter huanghezhanensis]